VAVVEAEVVGGVGHIVLNRPEALNSLNEAMIHGIRAASMRGGTTTPSVRFW
jgi:enoyl-CoA hydratase